MATQDPLFEDVPDIAKHLPLRHNRHLIAAILPEFRTALLPQDAPSPIHSGPGLWKDLDAARFMEKMRDGRCSDR